MANSKVSKKNLGNTKDIMFDFPRYINNSRVYQGDNYNFVSVKGGKYSINRNDNFYERYYEQIKNKSIFHLAERISKSGLTQLRCDIDQKIEVSKDTKPYGLLEDNIILNIIKKYFDVFDSYSDIPQERYECVILRKDPYIKQETKNGKTIYWLKHGIHLQFPKIYLVYNESKRVSEYMRDEFPDHVDYNAGFCNAWLLYGSCKDERYGTYIAQDVVDSNLNIRPFSLDKNVNIVKYLSVCGHRDVLEYWVNIEIPEKQIVKELSESSNSVQPYKRSIENTVQDWLEERNLNDQLEIGDWSDGKPFLQLKRLGDYVCPLNELYTHEGRGSYVYVDDKSGNIFYKCFRKECCEVTKNLLIGVCEECRDINNDLDLRCNESSKIYKSSPESKNSKYNNMTYGQIARQNIKFAQWCCDKNIVPHDYYFSKVLKREYIQKPISLDNINPDTVIDTNNIGTYNFNNVDTIFLRSNMMTHKTQSLKTILNNYKKIVYISFRKSLSNEVNTQLSEYNFVTYEDIEGPIYDDRVVIQIDSLHRLRGSYNLIIMDEAVYTLNHLVSFSKEKGIIMNTLTDLYKNCQHTVVCDALLDNKTINYIKSMDESKSCTIIENTYKPFKNKLVKYHGVNIHEHNKIIIHIEKMIQEYKKLYIPTNSQRFGEKVYDFYKDKYNILLIDKNTEHIPCSSTWKNYDMVICSPTVGAGISCNDMFGKTICYFSNNSCDASLSAQQILRVRNTESDTIDIFICENFKQCLPTNSESIKEMIKTKYSLDVSFGLKVNRIEDTIIEDDYYKYFVEYIRSNNISKIAFKRVLDGILINHGFSTEDCDLEEEEEEQLIQIKKTIKEQKLQRDDLNTTAMLESDIISKEEYVKINKKQRKSKEDRAKLEKYNLVQAYGQDGLVKLLEKNDLKTTRDFVKNIYKYKNLCLLMNKDVEESIKREVHYNDGIERLHDNKKACKIFTAYKIIEILGFDSVFDKSVKSELDYDNMLDWLKQWNYKVRTLWDEADSEDFSQYDIKDKKYKKLILERYNSILNKVLGVRVMDGNSKHSARDGIYKYKIYGLDKYDLVGGIKPNELEITVKLYDGKCGSPMLGDFYDEDDILVC